VRSAKGGFERFTKRLSQAIHYILFGLEAKVEIPDYGWKRDIASGGSPGATFGLKRSKRPNAYFSTNLYR